MLRKGFLYTDAELQLGSLRILILCLTFYMSIILIAVNSSAKSGRYPFLSVSVFFSTVSYKLFFGRYYFIHIFEKSTVEVYMRLSCKWLIYVKKLFFLWIFFVLTCIVCLFKLFVIPIAKNCSLYILPEILFMFFLKRKVP